jgi:hypothetical protein
MNEGLYQTTKKTTLKFKREKKKRKGLGEGEEGICR